MTMKTTKVCTALVRRIAWLGAKMESIADKHSHGYNALAQEKSATEYALRLVQRELAFQQRMRLEDRFVSRDDAYYDEFIRDVAQCPT